MLRIGVDGNLLCGKRTGMGTVVHNVLPFWKSDKDHQIILYVPEKLEDDYAVKLLANGMEIKVLGKANYFKWEQWNLPKAVRNDGVDVLWCPYNTAPLHTSAKLVVTINDVIYMTASLSSAPSVYKKMGIIYRRTIVPRAAKKATSIITISEFAKNEITNTLKDVQEKTQVIYLGADFSGAYLNEKERSDFFKKSGIKPPFILGFGSLEARKNSFSLIKAYESLPSDIKEKYQLVLFGFRGFEESEQYKYIKDRNLSSIILLGYVSDEEKNTLYKSADIFVFPSLSEGFGIPVLEAFANGTPVITSNNSSLPEVAGEAAELIKPDSIKDIENAILAALGPGNRTTEMVDRGYIQLGKFNWNNTAKGIFEIIIRA